MKKHNQQVQRIDDGFSSQEEIHHEEIAMGQTKIQQSISHHKEEVKFKLPPPQPIKAKSYSLNADIATGWTPKNDQPVPVPLLFEHKRLDCMISRIAANNQTNSKIRLVYLGSRFQSTYYSWYQKPFSFPYSHIKMPIDKNILNRRFQGQNLHIQDSIVFDSSFQSGNLDCAVKVGQRQYDLYLRVDSNTRGHLQWFYFKTKGLQKLQQYKFNICNFQKNKSLYGRGMKPYIFSQQKYSQKKISWEQVGSNIHYQRKLGKSAKVLNLEKSTSYRLSFEYYTQYNDDEVRFAYCIPYTYSQQMSFLKEIQKQCKDRNFFSKTKLCTSLGGLEVPLIIINQKNANESKNPSDRSIPKKCIIISGRAHPGQSNGSHMMQGFLKFLCGHQNSAKYLRKNFVFKIVPMLNPDGVALGNYRTGISGKDFNREYHNPQKVVFPEVFAFKKLVSQNKTIHGDNLLMFLDFHGHSIKKNVFMYGPEFPIIQKNYYQCRIFPKMLSDATNMFRYYSCSFKISYFKEATARAVLLRKLMIPFSYTIEASNGSYYDKEKLKDIPFTQKTWQEMGAKIAEALSAYGNLIIQSQKNRLQKKNQRLQKRESRRSPSKGRSFQLTNNSNNSKVTLNQTIYQQESNSKLAEIYNEINKMQENRVNQMNEQDNLSEGSSDGEGQKDDLTQERLKYLYDIIQNKSTNGHEILQHNKLQVQDDDQEIQSERIDTIEAGQTILKNESASDFAEMIFRPQQHTRGYLLRKKKINHREYQSSQKQEKKLAKVINFSFHDNHQSSSPRKKIRERSNSPLLQMIPNKKKNSDLTEDVIKNQKVLDLSDKTFKGTFGSGFHSGEKFVISDPKSSTFNKTSPRKMINRLDQFKYKRLFIDEYRV